MSSHYRAGLTLVAAFIICAAVLGVSPDRAASSSSTPAATYQPDSAEGTVYRLYRAYFLREPDVGGFSYWLETYRNGYPLTVVSDDFARSHEFEQRYGVVNDREFVRRVYANVLQREPDVSGYSYWTDQMTRGMPRGHVMIHFSDSKEFRHKTRDGVPPGYSGPRQSTTTTQPTTTVPPQNPHVWFEWSCHDVSPTMTDTHYACSGDIGGEFSKWECRDTGRISCAGDYAGWEDSHWICEDTAAGDRACAGYVMGGSQEWYCVRSGDLFCRGSLDGEDSSFRCMEPYFTHCEGEIAGVVSRWGCSALRYYDCSGDGNALAPALTPLMLPGALRP